MPLLVKRTFGLAIFLVGMLFCLDACATEPVQNSLGYEIQVATFDQGIRELAWSPDQNKLAVGVLREHHQLSMYEISSNRTLWVGEWPFSVFDPTGKYLIGTYPPPTPGDMASREVWEAQRHFVFDLVPTDSGAPVKYITDETSDDPKFQDALELNGHAKSIPMLAAVGLSADGQTLASLFRWSGEVALSDTKTWGLKKHLGPIVNKNGGSIFKQIFLDTVRNLVIAFDGTVVAVWDIETNKQLNLFQPFDPNAASVLTYNQVTGELVGGTQSMPKSDAFIEQLRAATNGKEPYVSTSSDDPFVVAWDPKTGKKVKTYEISRGDRVMALAVSPNGQYIAATKDGGLLNGYVQLWDAASGRLIGEIQYEKGHWLQNIVFSPDSKKLAYSLDSTVHIIEIAPSRKGD